MINFLKKIILFLFVLFPLASEAKLPPSIATGGNSLNVLFAVDISGSMLWANDWSGPMVVGSINGNVLTAISNCASLRVGSWISPVSPLQDARSTFPTPIKNDTIIQSVSGCRATLSISYTTAISIRTFFIEPGRPKYQNVQTAISTVIGNANLASKANFGLLTWSDTAASTSTAVNCSSTNFYAWTPLNSNKSANFQSMMNSMGCIGGVSGTQVDPPMTQLNNYFNSTTFSNFSGCATTIIIMMSDGVWSTNGTAGNIATALSTRTSNQIKTYVVAINQATTLTTFVNLAKAGGTFTSPGVLSGNNTTQLVSAFNAAIQSSLYDSYSAVAPTIMQKTSTNALILVPDFQYAATKQWIGHLTASSINADGSISSTAAWEFGANLNNVSPNARYIWTAAPNIPVNTSSTPNNFTTSNLTYLSSAMGDSTNLATQIINFIRGYDAFDENANGSTTDTRWKLNDIYNSKPIYVAQPEQTITTDPNFIGGKEYFYKLNPSAYTTFLNNTKNRKAMIYVGSNGGVLHGIDADTGNESWAFVPPPLLDKLDNVVCILPNCTNSIYGVDGSSVAQDVYVNGQWKTYLAVTLGMGARGYSVLDITNPTIPLHVFSIERYQDINGNESTRWWGSDGTLKTYSSLIDYQALGNTTSTPIFSYAKSSDGNYSPVLILGEGTSNNGITSTRIYLGATSTITSVGSGALIISLIPGQEGTLIHNKDVGYTSSGDSQTAITAITSIQSTTSVSNSYSVQITNTFPLDEGASVTCSSCANFPANTVVASVDSSTQVTFNYPVSLSAGTTLTFTRRIFNEVMTQVDILESGSTPYMQGKYGYQMLIPNNNGYIHSFRDVGTDASTIDYPYASFSPTAPRGAYGAFHVMNSGTTFSNDRLIQQPLSISNYVANPANQLNIVYGTGDMETLSMIDKSPDNLIVSIQDTETNIFGLNKSRSFLTTNSSLWGSSSLFMDATNTYSPTCQSNTQMGWYVRMNGLTAVDENSVTRSCTYAKLAAKSETYGGMVAAPIYIPPADLNSCALGSSALIYRDAKCGYQSAPPLYLTNMLIGGITTFKNNVYISVSSKSSATKVDAANKYTKVGAVVTGQPGFTFKPATLKAKLRIR